jgi:hypothetical protein
MSDMEFRYKTTRFIWGVFFALMMVLIISTSWIGGFSIFHFLIAGAMTLFTFVTTGTVWSWGSAVYRMKKWTSYVRNYRTMPRMGWVTTAKL